MKAFRGGGRELGGTPQWREAYTHRRDFCRVDDIHKQTHRPIRVWIKQGQNESIRLLEHYTNSGIRAEGMDFSF